MASVLQKLSTVKSPAILSGKMNNVSCSPPLNRAVTVTCWLVPREEVDNYLDADPDLIAHLSQVAQIIGQAGRDAFNVSRALIVVAGFDVPHLHIHVIPTDSMQVLNPDAKAAGVADGIKASCENCAAPWWKWVIAPMFPHLWESLG
ncbi:HIT domain [Mobiluncus curtisii]|uniref:HIT domain n=1 Tax=Mobiluncus curtisii TaxID=2051 RepID=A0A2X3BNT9_9ACTO|nr:HIT domain [Mobiluncus curtisii]